MCDAVLQNYAAAINGVSNANIDLIPSLLLFSEQNCGGTQFPNEGGTGFVTNPFTQGTSLTPPFTVQSFFIPFNFNNVQFNSNGNVFTSQFIGPTLVTNTAVINWQNGLTSMLAAPIANINFTSILNWNSGAMVPMCMGKSEFIGLFVLNRYFPTSDRCDTFMSNTWCSANINNTECSCFKELPGIEQKSVDLKVNLPVICFGENCATLRTYKTSGMLSKPCNLTICQQTVNATPGIINAGTDTVFCGGQFYTENGDISVPSVTPLPSPGGNTKSSGTPFYVWIMLGVSGLLFLILVYLLFAPSKGGKSSILRQIQKITSKKKATHDMHKEQGLIPQPSEAELTTTDPGLPTSSFNDDAILTEPTFDNDILGE
jgi:hypothetical protein